MCLDQLIDVFFHLDTSSYHVTLETPQLYEIYNVFKDKNI